MARGLATALAATRRTAARGLHNRMSALRWWWWSNGRTNDEEMELRCPSPFLTVATLFKASRRRIFRKSLRVRFSGFAGSRRTSGESGNGRRLGVAIFVTELYETGAKSLNGFGGYNFCDSRSRPCKHVRPPSDSRTAPNQPGRAKVTNESVFR